MFHNNFQAIISFNIFIMVKKITSTVFLLLFVAKYLSAQWSPVQNFGGGKTDGCFGFSLNGKGYVGGGSGSFWEYDPVANHWTNKGNNPGNIVRAFSTSFVVNGKAYVIGGDQAFNPANCLSDVWAYDPSSGWTKKKDYPAGVTSSALVFVINNVAYVGGGVGPTGIFGDFYKYDDANDNWTKLNDLPNPAIGGIYGSCSFSVNGKGYLVCGNHSNGTSTGDVNFVYEYNPAGDSWTPKNNFPGAARTFGFSFVLGNTAYVGGGATNATVTHKDFYQYDAALDKWTQLPNLPTQYGAWVASFVINGTGYIATGANVTPTNLVTSDSVYKYTSATGVSIVNDNPLQLSIYPNPTHDFLTVSGLHQKAQITLLDITGKAIQSIAYYDGGQIDISGLSAGMYILKVQTTESCYNYRFVKE